MAAAFAAARTDFAWRPTVTSSMLSPLFDFEPHKARREEALALIRQFAAHPAFRSAVVEELELDEDFYRRPLRPEDLEFLKFQKPITESTVSRLPSLASNRLLLCINELDIARLPRPDAQDVERCDAFYDEDRQVTGRRIQPFLETYAFSYLGDRVRDAVPAAPQRDWLRAMYEAESAQWSEMLPMLDANDYLQEGLRFIFIQNWSLLPSRQVAVARAAVSGYFDAVAPEDRPSLAPSAGVDRMMTQAAAMLGVARRAHSYWQFYLPTSLAKTNLLHALARRPHRAFALLGAAYAAEVEWLAFIAALRTACPHLATDMEGQPIAAGGMDALDARFTRALDAIGRAHGPAGLGRVAQGLAGYALLADRARWDRGEQLGWLSSIRQYCAWASDIEKRIHVECPNIDRETFVEPREMCSTTHVHNDHRLVVIEEGDMVFWGNLGMQLEMTVGDKVLIPDGRLHGSTVVSAECTYHQPIIPDAWIAELRARARNDAAASLAT
jgi:hypothetical protein